MADPVADLTGTTVGRFTVRVRLGAGGMGEVYRADDTKLKRSVALKRMAPHLRADARYRQRFLKEAERASRLTDQHIAGLYDVLEEGGETFLVMEYVEGETLRQRLERPLSIEEFLAIAVQCGEALVAAHQKDIVHRDLKPENIMITPAGQVKVLDFGVAKRLPRPDETADTASLGSVPSTGGLSGTPAYMAPETLLEKEADGRADIFSLGVVFYEALTGRHPFFAGSFVATSDRILREEPTPLTTLNPRTPAELERIVLKMLAKRPEERYQTAADLLVDLRALDHALREGPVRARLERAAKPWHRRRALRLALPAAVLGAAGLALLGYWYFQPPVVAERSWILVADFKNRTAEPLFDRTASELLRRALQQSRYVNVVPRSQVLEAARRMGRAEVTEIDAALGREICQRENYRALLTGEIAAVASTYQITAQLVDPWRDVTVITDSEAVRSPAELYTAVDNLTQRLRRGLGESLAQIKQHSAPLAQATTPSLEALQRYSRALDLYAIGDMERFFVLANSALELDPNFALAHLYLAQAYYRFGNKKGAREHMVRARQGLGQVTERERYLILAMDFSQRGLYEKAAEQYRLLAELYPDDMEGHRGLAEAAIWVGRPEEGIRAARRAVELNPRGALDHLRLLHSLNRVNRFREALAAYEEARARGVLSPLLHWGAGLAYLGEGNPQAARREFEQLRQGGGAYEENLAQLYSARVLMYEGRLREAVAALRAGFALDEKLGSETWVPVRRYLLARVQLARGQRVAALRAARQLAAAALAEGEPENLRRAGRLMVELGERDSTRQLLAALDRARREQPSAYAQSCYHNLEGVMDLAAGKIEGAINSQQAAAVFFSSFDPYTALGQAYRIREDWRNAIQAYERFLGFKGEILRDDFPGDWVLAHLHLARAFAQVGDTQQALRYYDEFLRLWGQADADLPAVEAAQAERRQLILPTTKERPPGSGPAASVR